MDYLKCLREMNGIFCGCVFVCLCVWERERVMEIEIEMWCWYPMCENIWWSCTGSMDSKRTDDWVRSISGFETQISRCKSLQRLTHIQWSCWTTSCLHLLSSSVTGPKDFSIKNEKMVSLCSNETQPLQCFAPSTFNGDSNLRERERGKRGPGQVRKCCTRIVVVTAACLLAHVD